LSQQVNNKQENHAMAKMTARCAHVWVPWKLYCV